VTARHADTAGLARTLRAYGTLSVHIRGAQGLAAAGASLSSTVVGVAVGEATQLARAASPSTNPNWDQTLDFEGMLGALMHEPISIKVLRSHADPSAPGEHLLGEARVSLVSLLDNLSSLSAEWDAIDLGASVGTLSMSATFAPGGLADAAVRSQHGRLQVHVHAGSDLALTGTIDRGCFVRVFAGGRVLDSAAITGGYTRDLSWEEALTFEGPLGDFVQVKVEVQVMAQTASGEPDLVGVGATDFARSMAHLDLMTEELGGVGTSVQLRPSGRLSLKFEWLPARPVPVSAELAARFPLIASCLQIKRDKREAPVEAILAHPASRTAFRAFADLHRTPSELSSGRRDTDRNIDAYLAIMQHVDTCAAAEARGAGGAGAEVDVGSPARVMAASAQAVYQRYLKETAPQHVELSPEASKAVAHLMGRGLYSSTMFDQARRCIVDNLSRGEYRRFTQSAAFADLLRRLGMPGHAQQPNGRQGADGSGPGTVARVSPAQSPMARAAAIPRDPLALDPAAGNRTGGGGSHSLPSSAAYDAHPDLRATTHQSQRLQEDLRRLQELRRENEAELKRYLRIVAQEPGASEGGYARDDGDDAGGGGSTRPRGGSWDALPDRSSAPSVHDGSHHDVSTNAPGHLDASQYATSAYEDASSLIGDGAADGAADEGASEASGGLASLREEEATPTRAESLSSRGQLPPGSGSQALTPAQMRSLGSRSGTRESEAPRSPPSNLAGGAGGIGPGPGSGPGPSPGAGPCAGGLTTQTTRSSGHNDVHPTPVLQDASLEPGRLRTAPFGAAPPRNITGFSAQGQEGAALSDNKESARAHRGISFSRRSRQPSQTRMRGDGSDSGAEDTRTRKGSGFTLRNVFPPSTRKGGNGGVVE